MKWTVILTKDNESDYYTAECLELPGAISEGDGVDGAIEMIQEAIELWLEVAVKYNDPIPTERVKVFKLADLEELPDYVVTLEIPIPQAIAA